MRVYLVHGVAIATDVDLPSCRLASDVEAAVTIAVDVPATVPDGEPDGRVLLRDADAAAGLRAIAVAVGAEDVVFRLPGVLEVRVEGSTVTCRTDPAVDPDMLGVWIPGKISAFLLGVGGVPAVHASTVQVGGAAVAFTGRSGLGKSMIAALACAGGASLVGDDVLRVDGEPPRARCGTTQIRLRSDPDTLGLAGAGPDGVAVDGRFLVRPPLGTDGLPLGALVVPTVRPGSSKIELHRLPPGEATAVLGNCDALRGWLDPGVIQRRFELNARVAAAVPVLVAALPWRAPFPPGADAELLAALAEVIA